MGTCRVVIEREPFAGVRNMALDEALLEAALERGECTVRWYRWETATVSLGYFQDASSATANFAKLPIVRRLSGGGAILHHHEWTYSCSVPASHPLAAAPSRIYELVHGQIIAELAKAGVSVSFRGQNLADREGTFLCFGRGDPNDIVLGEHKIVGSAQRRRRGTVLQHGSVLLERSEHAPQFPGLFDLADRRSVEAVLAGTLAERIGSVFGPVVTGSDHTRAIENRVRELEPRYRLLDWRRHQTTREQVSDQHHDS